MLNINKFAKLQSVSVVHDHGNDDDKGIVIKGVEADNAAMMDIVQI